MTGYRTTRAKAACLAMSVSLLALQGCGGDDSDEPVTLDDIVDRETSKGDGGAGARNVDVNLVVSSFAIDRELSPGAHETISAIIQNIGSGVLSGASPDGPEALHVGYYLSTDNVITVDDILLGDTKIAIGDFFTRGAVGFGFESLGPGENYHFDHPLAVRGNIAAGTYYAGAIVDYVDEYHWYDFARGSDTLEFTFPTHVTVAETNEEDNARLLSAHQVVVTSQPCADDAYENDNSSASAKPIAVGETQTRNFCHDNADWLKFEAVEGNVYKIMTSALEAEADTQLVLYDRDASTILLFNDNIWNGPFVTPCGLIYTADLECGWPPAPPSEIVWEAQQSATYFIRVRLTVCDEDADRFCAGSPDGPGLLTEYSILLQ